MKNVSTKLGKNLYIVRHCKAAGQAADAPLTELGLEQATKLADFFSDKSIDCILSSPYERAYSTIVPLAKKLGLPIGLDERLTERVLLGKDHPDWFEMLRETYEDLDLCYEGGESSRMAMKRAAAVVSEVREGGSSNAVIVTHGNLMSLLLKHFDSRIGFKEWEALSNPDVFQLSFLNDTFRIQRIWEG
ncbi:histidine phosphatase family protein [Paenibacillus eucommiae]|uniref:2,3-bisphosphoglycerate-dependent phosphoglycerate mutase n=1 Tax=Paenibacillus eucommiae TaxID=1355755 RepID=A0ABS4J5E8_9BACL|nr:histidine phosphatase family protein [Paenibacillus eucommiae]MBP1994019.1 2,3-bisphosphoglycerate-dependent phosphoglycerate mutase [Paenibacillus eucommiae]